MQTINRWRNWTPTGKKFGDCIQDELTELTKPTSVSFVSAIPRRTQNFSCPNALDDKPSPRPETLAQVELLPAEVRQWDDAMLVWARAHCAFREHSWGSLSRLYISHIEHAHQSGGMFAPDRETFQAILMALGFQIEDGMCYGLVLADDANAAHWQPEAPKAVPSRNRGRA